MARSIEPDDGTAVSILHLCYAPRLRDMPLAEFRRLASPWTLAFLKRGTVVMGVAARKSGELHIGILPQWRRRWATRGFIKDILRWAAESGPVTTGVMADNATGRRLVEGVGFVLQDTTPQGGRYALPAHAI